jgi:sulfatase maturation enzyme AslB (radical SAM superfamily)
MANTFCKHLSNSARFYIDDGFLSYQPCCYWDGPKLEFDPTTWESERTYFDNSTPWAHKECTRCGEEEKYTGAGLRISGNKTIPDSATSGKLSWLDFQADITCNGGCLICGPWNSSYWQSENFKVGDGGKLNKKPDLAAIADKFLQNLDLSELVFLQFLGGEPFLSDLDYHAAQYILNPQNCILKYTTNGSVYPDEESIAMWTKYKEVVLTLSIDGIGSKFDYLRYPLKWDIVDKNIRRMVKELPNVRFTINHSITPLNAYYYDEFLAWVRDVFPTEPKMHVHPAYGVMGVENTSRGIRKMILDKYGADHVISKMLASNSFFVNTEFITYIIKLDARRKTSVYDTFPEIAHKLTL